MLDCLGLVVGSSVRARVFNRHSCAFEFKFGAKVLKSMARPKVVDCTVLLEIGHQEEESR